MSFMYCSIVFLFVAVVHAETVYQFTPKHAACLNGESECFDKTISSSSIFDRVVCPGSNNHTCADGYTCCTDPQGGYACCPHADAVCCNDHIHCCPKGSTCDAGSCRSGIPTINSPDEVKPTCPGDEFQCPLKTTCCKVSGGQYGCCPFEEGTCCGDQLHCCPQGFECDAGGVCVHSMNSKVISVVIFDLH